MSRSVLIFCFVAAALLCVFAGCAALPPMEKLGPALEAAVPLRHGEKVDRVEPFGVLRPLEGGLTYVELDPAAHYQRGAWFSVNGGPWVTAATCRRGDRLDVAYTRLPGGGPAASALSYDLYGLSTRGYVRLAEHRAFTDGYPDQRRSLRVLPYEQLQQAAAR